MSDKKKTGKIEKFFSGDMDENAIRKFEEELARNPELVDETAFQVVINKGLRTLDEEKEIAKLRKAFRARRKWERAIRFSVVLIVALLLFIGYLYIRHEPDEPRLSAAESEAEAPSAENGRPTTLPDTNRALPEQSTKGSKPTVLLPENKSSRSEQIETTDTAQVFASIRRFFASERPTPFLKAIIDRQKIPDKLVVAGSVWANELANYNFKGVRLLLLAEFQEESQPENLPRQAYYLGLIELYSTGTYENAILYLEAVEKARRDDPDYRNRYTDASLHLLAARVLSGKAEQQEKALRELNASPRLIGQVWEVYN